MQDIGSPPPARRDRPLVITLAFLSLVLVAAVLSSRFVRNRQSSVPNAAPRPVMARGDLAEDEKTTIELFRQASPMVAFITTKAVRRDRFSRNVFEIPQGSGSGIVWDSSGHIVTNFHVIQEADQAQVMLDDQSTWDASLVGAAPESDLAVLRINAGPSKLTPVPIGTSHDLQVGQKVFAIGNPFGLDYTLTTGVISGLGREIRRPNTNQVIEDVIQTDAAINPGNSGGPLLDSAGRLIGINTAIYSPSGAYAGIGFAVPVDTINRVVPELIAHGRVVRPVLGVSIAGTDLARRLGDQGAIVLNVVPGSAADKAGIRSATRGANGKWQTDIIVGIDDKPIESGDRLIATLGQYKVGDTVTVVIERQGERIELQVELQGM